MELTGHFTYNICPTEIKARIVRKKTAIMPVKPYSSPAVYDGINVAIKQEGFNGTEGDDHNLVEQFIIF
jgi:hypothetical protein